MKWFRYARGFVFGITLAVAGFAVGGFDSTRAMAATVGFATVGIGLAALMVWAAIRDLRRTREERPQFRSHT